MQFVGRKEKSMTKATLNEVAFPLFIPYTTNNCHG